MGVTFAFRPSVTNEVRSANAVINKKLGLPSHRGAGRLAIVGGGPSINSHIEELQNWDGQVWAVNGAINWCHAHDIDAYFYTIDAAPIPNWTYFLHGVSKAVVALDCDPSLFATLRGADITTLGIPDGGPTSANAADWYAIECGHSGLTFFGCESSFGDQTHAFTSHPIDQWIVVRVGGRDYRTKPEFLEQARIMAEVIRAAPQYYDEKSGGLLSAMVEHGMDYELIDISPAVANILRAA